VAARRCMAAPCDPDSRDDLRSRPDH